MIDSVRDFLALNVNPDDYRIGKATAEASIAHAETLLAVHFSDEYRRFVAELGWMEIYNGYFFGVPADPEADEGSVVRMTRLAREHWELPQELFVIYSSDDEVLWCIDGQERRATGKVVAYDTRHKRLTATVAATFSQTLSEFLEA